MAVILQQVMPEGVSLEMLDKVTEEMGVEQNPPDGIPVHTYFEQDGRVRIVDVWESQDAFEVFREARLRPATQAVAQRDGMSEPPPEPESSITPVHRVVRGR